MKNFMYFLAVIAVIVFIIVVLGSSKSRFRGKLSMFLADSEERRAAMRRNMSAEAAEAKNVKGSPQKNAKKPARQKSAGERYYEKGGNVKAPSNKLQIEMVKLIRKSDDRLRVFDSSGKAQLFDEFYQLVFKTRRGETIKVECSAEAYAKIPFNQEGSLSYQKNRLVKFKYIDGTVYDR